MPHAPLDEAMTSEQARARIDELRERASQVAAERNATYEQYAAACARVGEAEDQLARMTVRSEGNPRACWRPRDTIVPVTVQPASSSNVDLTLLRAVVARRRDHARALEARLRDLTRVAVDLSGEANVLEARERERYRTGPLLAPDGSILPPRIVTRPPRA